MAPSSGEVRTLPKTIEGATSRYLCGFEKQFSGPANELSRLRNLAEAKITILRKKAPTFYETKLPKLVNQAASALLSCNCKSDARKINNTHGHFLRILDELTKSQPAGDVDFQTEIDRSNKRDYLLKKRLHLLNQIGKLKAREINCEDVGSDDIDSTWAKTFAEIDGLNDELKRVDMLIATIEGEKIDEEIEFELIVPSRSVLSRLGESQLGLLEQQIIRFLKANRQNKSAIFVDKSIIDGMLENLNIDFDKFTPAELNDFSKDALDTYRNYFRGLESERRNEYFETLLKSEELKPKEGLILESPDDIPDDVREQLDQSDLRGQRQLDEYCEEFAKRPPNDEGPAGVEDIVDEEDIEDTVRVEVQSFIDQNKHLFARVKEEPRDDYDNDAPSEDEIILDEGLADKVEGSLSQNGVLTRHRGEKRHAQDDDDEDDNDISDFQDASPDDDVKPNHNGHQMTNGFKSAKFSAKSTPKTEADGMYELPSLGQVADNLEKLFDSVENVELPTESQPTSFSQTLSSQKMLTQSSSKSSSQDDDIQLLGIVTPADKVIDCIQIDSDTIELSSLVQVADNLEKLFDSVESLRLPTNSQPESSSQPSF